MNTDAESKTENLPIDVGETETVQSQQNSSTLNAAHDRIMALPVELIISVGSTRMRFRDILELSTESVIDLNSRASDPVKIKVVDKKIKKKELIEKTPGSGELSVRINQVFNNER